MVFWFNVVIYIGISGFRFPAYIGDSGIVEGAWYSRASLAQRGFTVLVLRHHT